MVIAQTKLSARAHHAAALDTANFRLAQHHAIGRNNCALLRQNADKTGARIGGAANQLLFAATRFHRADLQAVSFGMRFGGDNFSHFKIGEYL